MPKKIQPREIREWLERHEAGDGFETIARAAKKDPRVIKKHVEAAMRQRDIKAAHGHLVEDALRQHQDDLMSVVQKLSDVVCVALPGLDVGDQETFDKGLELGSSVAYRNASGYTRLGLDLETGRIWGHFRQHMSAVPLWDGISKWREAMLHELNERLVLWNGIWHEAQRETGHKLPDNVDVPGDTPYLTRHYPWLIYQDVVHQLLEPEYSPVQQPSLKVEADGEIWFDTSSRRRLVAKVPGYEDRCIQILIGLISMWVNSSDAEAVVQACVETEQAAKKITEKLEDIKLLHFIPGRCEICIGLGL